MSQKLPFSSMYSPWCLVRYEGRVVLFYMLKGYGGGIVPGQAMGGRGYVCADDGAMDTSKEVSVTQAQIIRDWRNRPPQNRIDQWRAAEA